MTVPVELPPISRRGFLARSLAAGVGLAFAPNVLGGEVAVLAPASSQAPATGRFALLSDLHIHYDRGTRTLGINLFRNLTRACAELMSPAGGGLPEGAMVCGDCTLASGNTRDYATL